MTPIVNPDLPKIRILFRDKEIEIPYHYPKSKSIQYIDILDGKGNEHRFYKGMYSPGVWFAKDTDHWDIDFMKLLVAEFDKLEPQRPEPKRDVMIWGQKRWWEM